MSDNVDDLMLKTGSLIGEMKEDFEKKLEKQENKLKENFEKKLEEQEEKMEEQEKRIEAAVAEGETSF